MVNETENEATPASTAEINESIATARPSSTVVLLRDSPAFEVLLLQRNAKIQFHGGSWVFPGGKVETSDWPQSVAAFDHLSAAQRHQAFESAAIRETHEEAGIELSSADLALFSTWLTPRQLPKRFDAWFYVARCPEVAIQIDDGEIKDYQWLSPTAALAMNTRDELRLPPPTYMTLLALSHYDNVASAIEALSAKVAHFRPKIAPISGGFVSLYEQDAGYEAGDPHINGARHRLIKQGDHYRYESNERFL